ncbi:glycoside hydrolase family 32 protein [Frigoriglobus tundricola]|uniref:Retaining endo-levanase or other beta-fructosidase n=1 Tax=Frigoriglobus tundricola TaxID=2774151 RepID=A0A6M5YP37_9BACT|nr:glycoside hydrolase family 32 protein [Frigoriglobus tundricola]QJW95254.1 retaining endo-levanase or other beta-fructosidase [Frigoriglobus tundricola]
MIRCAALLFLLVSSPLAAADRADLPVADFEGDTYGDGWKTTGTAFGKGPARGTLPNQMPVSGHLGKGLVNSYLGGDTATGTLTSPEIRIERKYINFLIGGGKHPGKTCINLLVGGKIVRTATGPNDTAGGSEHLDWHTWDVAEFEGKAAVIVIVDDEKGGWGHINVDQIVQSDAKKRAEVLAHTFDIEKPYLHLPVKTGAPVRRVKFVVGKETVREFDIELAPGAPDFWATADVSAFKGKKLTVEALLPADARLAGLIVPADTWANADKVYQEKHRPLFHFTSRVGWLNDPNGLVYANGEWHLFYQHNPFGREWGNMHWGHATSGDLFRWKEHGVALYPKKYGDWAFSGSAVADKENTSGWGTKEKPPLVLAYTSTDRGECIAYSVDNGRTWKEYDKNPVVKHAGRDPKLIWHEKAKHWVMAVYDELGGKQWIAFHTSPDLKEWKFASRIEGFYECPDLFALPVDENPEKIKWVLYAADGKYLLGDFDGTEFKPDFKEKKQLWHGRFYAAQSFDNAPAGAGGLQRRVQIGWAQGVTFPGTPFNQQMAVPVELRLVSAPDGACMTGTPVRELESLRDKKEPLVQLKGLDTNTPSVLAENLDAFEMVCTVGTESPFVLNLRGTKLTYDPTKKTLSCNGVTARVDSRAGSVPLQVLVDRGSVEVFANGGRVAMSVAAIPAENNRKVEFSGHLSSGSVWRLKSAWEK